MNIAFRVDASIHIGTGHFMRCLTLADALKQRGVHIRFVSRHMPDYLRDMLVVKRHEFIPLDSSQSDMSPDDLSLAHWLDTSQDMDAQNTIQALSDQTWDWLVVDHYALDSCWESVLRQAAKNILVIDDIADRIHDCDALLDQNFYVDMNTRYIGKVPPNCRLWLGPRYALLRKEFQQVREKVNPRTGPVKRILIFFGGMDADNYTGRILDMMVNIGISELHVDVVIGTQHPFREQIELTCVEHGFFCHVQTNRMAELMALADLSIGAGGSAIWERCCLGLPTLVICGADNQRKQIADAASEGLLYAVESKDELIITAKRHMRTLLENDYLRHVISRNGMQAVDGRGVLRVTGNLGCSCIKIRTARHDDSQKLFEWRNHPTIRAVSHNTNIISWESHQEWFASVLNAPDILLLIGQQENLPVGVVRFDIRGDEAEVSIYLAPYIQQSGQGRDLLQSAERWFAANQPNVSKICAHVLECNERSHRLFLSSGYQVESTYYSKRLQ